MLHLQPGPALPGQRFPFRAPPQAATVLADLRVRRVTLANNHALDFGPLALTDTVGRLGAAGISVTGAGQSAAHARAPAMLTAGGLMIAVLGVTDHPAGYAATAGHPEWRMPTCAPAYPAGSPNRCARRQPAQMSCSCPRTEARR